MAYSFNPLTWQFDINNDWDFYSKSEIDIIISNIINQLVQKLSANSVNWTFTTTDWKTITVVWWQITNIT